MTMAVALHSIKKADIEAEAQRMSFALQTAGYKMPIKFRLYTQAAEWLIFKALEKVDEVGVPYTECEYEVQVGQDATVILLVPSKKDAVAVKMILG